MDRIKESFDSLPIAACFFDENDVVRLVNRRMLAIANWLRKGGIQSLEEMQSALHSPPANVRCLDPVSYTHLPSLSVNLPQRILIKSTRYPMPNRPAVSV